MATAVLVRAWLEHEHGIGLTVGAEAGQVDEGAVWTEDVVGIVGAHLEPAGRHDEPLPGESGADLRAASRGIRTRL